jgi:hypothetical protein
MDRIGAAIAGVAVAAGVGGWYAFRDRGAGGGAQGGTPPATADDLTYGELPDSSAQRLPVVTSLTGSTLDLELLDCSTRAKRSRLPSSSVTWSLMVQWSWPSAVTMLLRCCCRNEPGPRR